jgi:cytochrome c556
MPMHRHFIGAVAASGVLLVAAVALSQQAKAPATVRELMFSNIVPASEVIFAAQAEPPTTREGWAAVERAADELAAAGRLLTQPPHARAEKGWKEQADELVAQSLRVRAAAGTQDADTLLEAGDSVYVTCKTCHDEFIGGAR